MLRNGKDIADGAVIETQVCIVGSGPAGITAAWELQKAGVKVTLIEGGPDSPKGALDPTWPAKSLLYAGKADGQFAESEPDFLIRPYNRAGGPWERERMFGGTSAHWGGQSRPLDPIDFEARPGFPGWPIDRAELDPYYAKAAQLCLLHGDDFSPQAWAEILGAEVPELTGFDTTIYQYLGENYLNFALRKFDGVTIADSDADVIVNATLLQIEQHQGRVCGLRVASMGGASPPKKATEFTIKADMVVLACGAVENARQLLLSDVGNDHDQVGRYFMCHPLSNGPVLSASGAYLTDAQTRLMAGQTLSGNRAVPWQDANGVRVSGRFSPTADEQKRLGIGSCWFWANYGQYYFEMAPNPDSRVTLADTVDPVFGQRQTHITWLLSDRDEATYTQTTALFKAAVEELGGDVYYQPWPAVKEGLTVNGHHIGTTRMSADPAQGVVDADLKVHGLDNLYVAGSSVFPSTGISNPTFTIITLSIRLAEHLRGRVGSP